MPTVSEVIQGLSTWTASLGEAEIDECYLFGSAIYQDGAQFDHHEYGSDLDIVVKLRSDSLDALARRDVWKSLLFHKLRLENELLPILKVFPIRLRQVDGRMFLIRSGRLCRHFAGWAGV
jgi:hypothetical protein